MIIHAMNLRVADVLSDGTVVASLSRSQGHTYAKLEDGRRMIAPDYTLLGVTRPTRGGVAATERKGVTLGVDRGLRALDGGLEA